VVDIVSVPDIPTRIHDGPLPKKTLVIPILIEGENVINAHPVTQMPAQLWLGATRTYYVVALFSSGSDLWLTARQRAHTMKWIRSKADIMLNDIREDLHVGRVNGGYCFGAEFSSAQM